MEVRYMIRTAPTWWATLNGVQYWKDETVYHSRFNVAFAPSKGYAFFVPRTVKFKSIGAAWDFRRRLRIEAKMVSCSNNHMNWISNLNIVKLEIKRGKRYIDPDRDIT